MAKRTAVIDIGSNSIRLVIYEKTSRFAFHLIQEVKSRVRIGENSYLNNSNITAEAMQTAYDALNEFKTICISNKVQKTLCIATSALRDAPNKSIFINRIKKDLNINIKVISGEKESYFGALSCSSLLPKSSAITVDIGGGSTEFAIIDNANIVKTMSLNLGTVRLKELFFDNDDIDGAIEYIDNELLQLGSISHTHIMGIGGTFRTLSSIILDSSAYPLDKIHGFNFSSKTLFKYIDKILSSNENQLKELGVKKERFDVIKPGVLILMRVAKYLSTDTLTCSGVGVREGVFLADLLRNSNHKFPNNFNTSLKSLQDKHCEQPRYTNMLAKVCKNLFELLHVELQIESQHLNSLTTAAKLSKIGGSLHFYSLHQHSYYLIQSALEYGYTHQENVLISTLVRFQKRRLPSSEHYEKYKTLLPNIETLNVLSFILSLSDTLLIHQPRNIDFELKFEENTVKIISKEKMHLAKERAALLKTPKKLNIEFVELS
ncbi:MAG: Ppx/GppA phosphatase family protein [Campylobacterota bacterium]|nr:Ppx/GppA phosphatase family protein [Campylobacterota bacterium]